MKTPKAPRRQRNGARALAMAKRDAISRAAPSSSPRPLSEAERAELLAFRDRIRPHAPRFQAANGTVVPAAGTDPRLLRARFVAAVGTADEYAMAHLMNQAIDTNDNADVAAKCNTAMAILSGVQPRNEIEGMLAVQMTGCHNLAMKMLGRAAKTEQPQFLAPYGNLAAKFMRVFTLQTEALARLRGQTGQQVVRVEHVTVEAGGQAVVGAVTTGGGGG